MLSGIDRPYRTLLAVCLVVAALLTLAIAAIRVHSVVRDGEWAQTTGYEAGTVNIVYRVANGIGPYGDLALDATPGVFNGLFYAAYGAVARPLVNRPVAMVAALRLFSLAIMAFAAMVFAREAARILDRRIENRGARMATAWTIAIVVCFGPFVGWWWLTVRPDVGVFACEALALAAARRSLDEGHRRALWVAPISLAIAWGFKQNAVMVAIALFLFMPGPRWRNRLTLVGAFAAVLVALVVFGGPHYLTHTLWMPAISQTPGLQYAPPQLLMALRVGAPFLLLPIAEVRSAWRRSASGRLTAFLFVLSAVAATMQLARVGPSRNYFLTSYLAGALLLLDAFAARRTAPAWHRAAMIAAAVYVAVLPTLYLVAPNRLGRVTVTTLDVADARSRVEAMRTAPAPRYVDDNIDALPWHSGQAVIETIDEAFYQGAVGSGAIRVTIADRARAFYYASAFVRTPEWRGTFQRAGYVLVTTLPGDVAYYRRPAT